MRHAIVFLLSTSIVAGCGGTLPPAPARADLSSVAIVPSRYEPAAQFDPEGLGRSHGGAVVGAAGGAGVGAMSAHASAGLLCTLGGPLCLIVVIPAAIVGGVVGGLAGGVVDVLAHDPGNRIADARGTIEQAVAEMRLTDAVARSSYGHARDASRRVSFVETEDYRALAAQGISAALEVDVTELQILPREKEMALALRARSRLYRTADGELIGERLSEAQTDFRPYLDWAKDEAQPLRRAVDDAVAQLGRAIVSEHLGRDRQEHLGRDRREHQGLRPRADIAARPGG